MASESIPSAKNEQESWSQAELIQLKAAVDRHGRDWFAVSRDVGSKTRQQCRYKVAFEVAAGRMQEPGGKQKKESWSQAELIQLEAAVDRHGRDWFAVSHDVGSKTKKQCIHGIRLEVARAHARASGQSNVGPVEHGLAAQAQASRGPARPRLDCRLARRRQQDQQAVLGEAV